MFALRIADIRRKRLIDATSRVLIRDGLRFTTMSKIKKEAASSRGLVHYYFSDKQQLILSAIRYIHAQRKNELIAKLRASRTPLERLHSVLSVLAGEPYLRRDFCRLWVSCNTEAINKEAHRRLQRIIRKREISNLKHALRQLLTAKDASFASIRIIAMIEGSRLWIGYMNDFDPKEASSIIQDLIEQLVPAIAQT
jgi:transcriptional repressor BetI